MVIIIDSAEKITGFLAQLEDMEVRGVVAIDEVEIVRPGQLPGAAQ